MKSAERKQRPAAAEREPQPNAFVPGPERHSPLRPPLAQAGAHATGKEGPHASQVAPQAADRQPAADAGPTPARALFGPACASILRRAQLTDDRPPFDPRALRWLTTPPDKRLGRPRDRRVTEAMRLRAAGATWCRVYLALGVPSGEQRDLREATYKRKQRLRRRAQRNTDK